MNKMLSICIPTYNREIFLSETIESILNQVYQLPPDYRDNIELCISDNSSSDSTSKLVESYQKHSSIHIIYHKNDINIGPDANFLKVVSLSTAEFAWLLGSDDKIEQGGIKFIYEYIKSHTDVDIFVLNTNRYAPDGRTLTKTGNNVRKKQRDKTPDILLFYSPLEASLNIVYEAGFISILCFRKSLWDKITGHEEFIGSLYVHLYKILSMIKCGARVVRIYKPPIVAYRSFNEIILSSKGKFNSIMTLLESFYKIPMVIYGENSVEHLALAKKNIRLNFPPILLSFWLVNFSLSERKLFLRKFFRYCKKFSFFYWTVPFLILPLGCCGKFAFIYPVDRISEHFHKF
jgi:abequosyltransferase